MSVHGAEAPQNGLLKTLLDCRARDEAALVAYVMAGDPHLLGTERFVLALCRAGADIIELGVPFSDPLADGPTNARACERALSSGTTLRGVLGCVARLRQRGMKTPLLLFTYLNPLLQMGLRKFAQQAAAAGLTGVLILDMPPEEAEACRGEMLAHGLEMVFLAAPTTPPARLRRISEAATGFVYYVSRTGVTGVRSELPVELVDELALVRAHIDKPVAVGFGVGTPEQARQLAAHADGVVVGSAFVQRIEDSSSVEEAEQRLGTLAGALKSALRNRARNSNQ